MALALVLSRDALLQSRTQLINRVRGAVKSERSAATHDGAAFHRWCFSRLEERPWRQDDHLRYVPRN